MAVGKGPLVSFHDGFFGLEKWASFLSGADRIALDYHPYLCFGGQPTGTMEEQVTRPCDAWGAQMNTSMDAFGMTGAGEFSNAVTDCGKWVNGVNLGTRYEGNYTGFTTAIGSCDPWVDYQTWDADFKTAMKQYSMASMDALQVGLPPRFESARLLTYVAELVLLDLEDWKLVCHWQGRVSCVVVQAWSRRRLDADGPPRGGRRVQRHPAVERQTQYRQWSASGGADRDARVAADDHQPGRRRQHATDLHAHGRGPDAHRADCLGKRDLHQRRVRMGEPQRHSFADGEHRRVLVP